jgi:hypothetical protein
MASISDLGLKNSSQLAPCALSLEPHAIYLKPESKIIGFK